MDDVLLVAVMHGRDNLGGTGGHRLAPVPAVPIPLVPTHPIATKLVPSEQGWEGNRIYCAHTWHRCANPPAPPCPMTLVPASVPTHLAELGSCLLLLHPPVGHEVVKDFT